MGTGIGRRGTLGPWKGRAFLSLGSALYLGPAGDTTPHAHHALQVCVALGAPFRLRPGGGYWREYEAAIVPADVSHQLDGRWADLLLFYFEPESASGLAWLPDSQRGIQPLDRATASRMRATVRGLAKASPDSVDLAKMYDELLPRTGKGPDSSAPLDPRVAEAVGVLRSSPQARRSLLELAGRVGLSSSRFRHLFRREIGMSPQSYVLWLRIYEACTALAQGSSLSDAALEAGFSDAAHFTRTFRRTFGLAPSQVAGRLTLVETHSSARAAPDRHLAR